MSLDTLICKDAIRVFLYTILQISDLDKHPYGKEFSYWRHG